MAPRAARARAASRVPRAVILLCALAACGREQRTPSLRQWTDDLAFQISSDPMPPRAREKVLFKVVVRDKDSRRPIETGEGRIYATSRDGKNVWDALDKGPELGTYYGTLSFITSGDWAVGLQFRRDSVSKIETLNWMQDVLASRGEP